MRPSGDTARGLVFDDFVDKQVVHVSATSFRSGAERVSMYVNLWFVVYTWTLLFFHQTFTYLICWQHLYNCYSGHATTISWCNIHSFIYHKHYFIRAQLCAQLIVWYFGWYWCPKKSYTCIFLEMHMNGHHDGLGCWELGLMALIHGIPSQVLFCKCFVLLFMVRDNKYHSM